MKEQARESQITEYTKPKLRKVFTSKIKNYTSTTGTPPTNARAKTSKDMAHQLNPDYDYDYDQDAYLEEKEIQNQVRIMINDAKRVRRVFNSQRKS